MRESSRPGHIHIVTTVLLIFALIGAWATYEWYRENTVKQNLLRMGADYKRAVLSVVSNPSDREQVKEALEKVKDILGKYTRETNSIYYQRKP